MKNKGKNATADERARRWWQYGRRADDLYRTIAGMEWVLVRSRIANLNSWDFTSARIVNSEATVIVAKDSTVWFALMQNSLQAGWILEYASSMRTDVRYTPSDCFETFPFPLFSDSASSVTLWLDRFPFDSGG